MMVGVEMKVLLVFRETKPKNNDTVQKLCLEMHNLYLRDLMNPFNENDGEPSDDLKAQLMNYLIK